MSKWTILLLLKNMKKTNKKNTKPPTVNFPILRSGAKGNPTSFFFLALGKSNALATEAQPHILETPLQNDEAKPQATPEQTQPLAYFTPKNPKPTSKTPAPVTPKRIFHQCDDDEIVDQDVEHQDDKNDPDYLPASDTESDEELIVPPPANAIAETLVTEMKYIVFESKICELVRQVRCRECNSILVVDDEPELGFCKGCMLSIKLDCLNGHPWSWQSQPLLEVEQKRCQLAI